MNRLHKDKSRRAARRPPGDETQADGSGEAGRVAASPEKRVLNALRRIVHAVDLHSRRLLRQCTVTAPQLVCLQTLAEEGPLTSRMLAERVHVNPSTLVGILDRLEERGFVERRRDRQDRRSVSLQVTERGIAFAREAPSPLQGTLMARLKEMHRAEQERLAGAMEEVVRLMEAEELPPTPIMALPRYANTRGTEVD